MNNHLTPQQMLAYVDGELSSTETRGAESHLHSCWTCLTEVERLKSDIATILDAQNECFAPSLPPPPRPWASFEALLARTFEAQPVSPRILLSAYMKSFFKPVRILLVSAIVVLLLFSSYAVFRARPVSAKEVLRRIQVADVQRNAIGNGRVIRERIRIRETNRGRNRAQVGTVDTWKSRSAVYWNVAAGNTAAIDLKAAYRAQDLAVDLPLSAASINRWGKAAGSSPTTAQHDSDVSVSFGSSVNHETGSVERVTLLVELSTWRVKQMTLDFRDTSFEVTEDDYSVMPISAVPPELLAYLEPEAAPSLVSQPAIRPSLSLSEGSVHHPMVNLDKAELDVFLTLRNLKADLGEPVTVVRTSHSVEIGVWELPAARQRELQAAFAGEPGVEVQMTAPPVSIKSGGTAQEVSTQQTANGAPLQMGAGTGEEDQRLSKFFGGAEREQDFTNEALSTSTAMLSHLYALRNLQAQFSPAMDRSLAVEEQLKLHMLVRDHVTAISASLDAIGRQLAPLDAKFGITPCTTSGPPAATNWQSGSLEALETARGADHLLRALLTTSQTPVVPDSALAEIDRRFCRLRAELKSMDGAAQ